MTLQGTLFFVVLAVLGLNLRVLATVPAGFTEIGEFFPPCQFASNESSPFPFNFDLSALQVPEENLDPANRVVFLEVVRSLACVRVFHLWA